MALPEELLHREPLCTKKEPTPDHRPASNAGSEGEHHQVIDTLARPAPPLPCRRRCRVVHGNRHRMSGRAKTCHHRVATA